MFFFYPFLLTIFLTYFSIKYQKRISIFNPQRNLEVKSHEIKKNAVSFGGIGIYFSITLFSLLLNNKYINLILIFSFFYFVLGFIDDFYKLKKKQNSVNIIGISGKKKILSEVVFAFFFIYFLTQLNIKNNTHLTDIFVPYLKIFFPIKSDFFYYLFKIFLLVGTVNAINITDGMDGLVTKNLILIFLFYLCYLIYLYLSFNLNQEFLAIIPFLFTVLGSLLGFLIFNKYPASIFMGDCGSLMLGSIFASTTIILGLDLILPFVGILFILETLSVIVQVLYFKYSKKKYGNGKRIFLCAPFHHHLEKKNIHESEIVFYLTLLTFFASIIGFYGIFK